MENQAQIDYLKKQIELAIKGLFTRRNNNKTKAFVFQISITILSSISTIILGLNIPELKEFTRITALIISTLITIFSGIDAFFNHKRLWTTYADTLNAMYSLRFDLEYTLLRGEPITNENLDNFKNRYQAILDTSNEKWMKLRNNDCIQE